MNDQIKTTKDRMKDATSSIVSYLAGACIGFGLWQLFSDWKIGLIFITIGVIGLANLLHSICSDNSS